jgi:hypothetical protein
MSATSFDPMRPDEVEVFAVDFRRRLGSGVTLQPSAQVVAVLADDENETPVSGMVTGAAGVTGTVVSQLIAGVAEGSYTLLFRATTTQGETIIEARDLEVRRDLT